MEFVPAKCPSCGGELMLPPNLTEASCLYCQSKFLVKEAIQIKDVNLENWEIIAKSALESRNYERADEYFTKILEYAPKNVSAWIGKASANGYLGHYDWIKFDEMITSFKMALQSANDPEKEELKKEISNKIFKIFSKCYEEQKEILYEPFNRSNTIFPEIYEQNWLKYVRFSTWTFAIVNFGINLDPTNINLLILGMDQVKFLHNGVRKVKSKISDKYYPKPDYDKKILEKFAIYKKLALEADKNVKIPDISKKEGCFIATATLGDTNHPYIIKLQNFRDHNLVKTERGRLFISIYYFISPFLSKLIMRSKILRFFSLYLIIKPVVKIIETKKQIFLKHY